MPLLPVVSALVTVPPERWWRRLGLASPSMLLPSLIRKKVQRAIRSRRMFYLAICVGLGLVMLMLAAWMMMMLDDTLYLSEEELNKMVDMYRRRLEKEGGQVFTPAATNNNNNGNDDDNPWQLADDDERVQMTLLEKAHAIYTLVEQHGDDVKKKLAVCAEYHESTTSSSSPSSKSDDPSYQLWWNGAARYVGWAAPQLYATSAVGQTRFLMIPKSATMSIRAALASSFHDLFSTNGELFEHGGEGEGFYWSINSTRTHSLAVRNHDKIITQHGGHVVGRDKTRDPAEFNDAFEDQWNAEDETIPIDAVAEGTEAAKVLLLHNAVEHLELLENDASRQVAAAAADAAASARRNLLLSKSSQPRRDLASYYGAAFTTNPIDRIIKGYIQLHFLKATNGSRWFDPIHLQATKNYTMLRELMQSEFPQFVDDLYNQVSSRVNGKFDVHGSPMMPFFYNAFADMRELLEHDIGVAGSYRRRWNSADIVNTVVQFVGKTETFDEDWKRMLDDRDAFIGSKNNSIVAPFANAKEVGRKNAHTGRMHADNLLQRMSHVNTMGQHVAEMLCASLFMDFVCLGYEFPPECYRFERAIKTNQLNRDVPLPLVY